MTGRERREEIKRQISYILKERREYLEELGINRREISGAFARAMNTTHNYASSIMAKYEHGLVHYPTTARYITNASKNKRRPEKEHYRLKYLHDIGIYLRILGIKPPELVSIAEMLQELDSNFHLPEGTESIDQPV